MDLVPDHNGGVSCRRLLLTLLIVCCSPLADGNQLPLDLNRIPFLNLLTGGGGGGRLPNAGGLLAAFAPRQLQPRYVVRGPPVAAPKLPKLTQLIPNAKPNFGVKQGPGCLPFLSEVIRFLWQDCQQKVDARAWASWNAQIQRALRGGRLDLLGAAKETCRLSAERDICGRLGQNIENCNILGSIQTTVDMQRAFSRCDQLTLFNVQGLNTQLATGNILQGIGNLVTGDLTGGLLKQFFSQSGRGKRK